MFIFLKNMWWDVDKTGKSSCSIHVIYQQNGDELKTIYAWLSCRNYSLYTLSHFPYSLAPLVGASHLNMMIFFYWSYWLVVTWPVGVNHVENKTYLTLICLYTLKLYFCSVCYLLYLRYWWMFNIYTSGILSWYKGSVCEYPRKLRLCLPWRFYLVRLSRLKMQRLVVITFSGEKFIKKTKLNSIVNLTNAQTKKLV